MTLRLYFRRRDGIRHGFATSGAGPSMASAAAAADTIAVDGEGDGEGDGGQVSRQARKQILGAFNHKPQIPTRCTAEHELACSYIDKVAMSEAQQGESLPEDLLCPITHQAMRVPVVASDGFSYEYDAIYQWTRYDARSPITREPLTAQRAFTRNRVLENLTREWARSHAKARLSESLIAALGAA